MTERTLEKSVDCDVYLKTFEFWLKRLPKLEGFEIDRWDDFLQDVGIEKVTKRGFVVLFSCENKELSAQSEVIYEFDIWMGDNEKLGEEQYKHQELIKKLDKFHKVLQYGGAAHKLSAFLFVDQKEKLYLFIDSVQANFAKTELNSDRCRMSISQLLKKYGIEGICGCFWEDYKEGESEGSRSKTLNILDEKIFYESRVEDAILNTAIRYTLTNFEHMRFRILVESMHQACILFDWDNLAEEIIEERSL